MRKMNYPLTRTRCVLGRQGEHLTTLSECSNWDCPQQALINSKIQSSNCNFPHPSLLDLSELFTNILTNIDSLLLLAPHLHIFSSSSLPTLPVLFTTLCFFPLILSLDASFLDFLSHRHTHWEVSFYFSRSQAFLLAPQICGKASRLGCEVAVRDMGVAFTGTWGNFHRIN